MGEEVIRLRATRAGNRSVVTKLVSEVEQISHVELNAKARDRLKRIAFMLDQKAQLLSGLNEQILALCQVEEIEKDIEDADEFTMRIMDTKAEISMMTTPSLTTMETPPPSTIMATTSTTPSSSNATTPPLTHVYSNQHETPTTSTGINSALQSHPTANTSPQPTLTAKLPKLV